MCIFLLLFLSLFENGATGLWTWSVAVFLLDVYRVDWDELVDVEAELDQFVLDLLA